MPSREATRQTLSIPDLAVTLGIDRSSAYELAKRDLLPVPVIRVGRRLLVSQRAVDRLLASTTTVLAVHKGVGDQPA